jgi:hypothetical protein
VAYSYLAPGSSATDVRILRDGLNAVVTFASGTNPGRYGDYSASCVVDNEVWTLVNYGLPDPSVIPSSTQWSAGLWYTPRMVPSEDVLEPFIPSSPASSVTVPPAGDPAQDTPPQEEGQGVERVPSDSSGDLAAWDIGH